MWCKLIQLRYKGEHVIMLYHGLSMHDANCERKKAR